MITASKFAEATGHRPLLDDLERVNCQQAGTVGHYGCGWCELCDKPRFVCGHLQEHRDE